MKTLHTHDQSLHGYKYCIKDQSGNIISVVSTKEAQAREFEMIGEEGDSMIEVLFAPY